MKTVNSCLDSVDIMNYIDGTDIFGSAFLYELDNTESDKVYASPFYTNRLDLITKEMYNCNVYLDYYGMVGVFNRITDFNDIDTTVNPLYYHRESTILDIRNKVSTKYGSI